MEAIVCSLTGEMVIEAVVCTLTGYVFERSTIRTYLKDKPVCPFTKQPL